MKLPHWKIVEDINVFGHPIAEHEDDDDYDHETIDSAIKTSQIHLHGYEADH